MKMKKQIVMLLLIAMSVTILFGCSGKEVAKEEGKAASLTPIVISEFRGLSWLQVYVAYQLGFFQEEGLEPTFAKYKDGPIAFQGMHGGDSQFCLLSEEPVLKAQQEGLKSSIIYSVLDTRLYGFVGASDITDVAQLKGKAIFAGMPGSAPYSFVSAVLREAGLNPEKDVTFVSMDYGASMSALSKGEIKASYINVDNRVEIEDMDVNILVDTARAYDAAKYLKENIFTGEIICATADYVKENPGTVQKFINAVNKGTEWVNSHKSEEIAKLIAPLFNGMTEDVLAKKIEITKQSITKTGYISKESQAAVENFCINNGVITKQIPYEDIVDMTFVNKLK